MSYKIKKAPKELLNVHRGQQRLDYPIGDLKVGEMFKTHSKLRGSIYNHIKHRRNYTKEFEGKIFTVKSLDKETIAVIRIA